MAQENGSSTEGKACCNSVGHSYLPLNRAERGNKPVSHYGHFTNVHAHCLILSQVLHCILPSKTWNQQETEMFYGLHAAAGHKHAHSQQQLNLVQRSRPRRRDALHHQAHQTICFSFFPPFLLESTVTSSLASRGMKIELSRCCNACDRGWRTLTYRIHA